MPTTLNEEKHILVFIDWYLPGYRAGGPIQSLANLVARLPFHFWIVTSAYDHHSEAPYPDLPQGAWVKRRSNEHVCYLPKEGMRKDQLEAWFSERSYHAIYINSLFSRDFALRPLRFIRSKGLQEKTILAPRGMLKPGALSVKAKKKKLFLWLTRRLGFFEGLRWAASSEEEREEIIRHFGRSAKTLVAPNVPRTAQFRELQVEKHPGDLHLVSIARVSPEKNILGGVEALAKLSGGSIKWDVYGTLQNMDYLASCRQAAKKTPHLQVTFHGEIQPTEIAGALEKAHFMYLPTLGENYGHAIAESFLSGVPVIISDRTPWRDLETRKAGFDCSLQNDDLHKVLHSCLAMDDSAYQTLAEGAARYGQEIASDTDAVERNLALFTW